MLEKIASDFFVGIVAAALGAIFLKSIQIYRAIRTTRYQKTTCFVVTKFRSEDAGHQPFYVRENESLAQHGVEADPVPVYNECYSYTVASTNKPTHMKPMRASTDGQAQIFRVFPITDSMWNDRNFTDRKTASSFTIESEHPGTVLGHAMTRWNGIKGRHSDYGTTAEYEHQLVTLIVDFTLIPNHAAIFQNVQCRFEPSSPGGAAVTLPRMDIAPGKYAWTHTSQQSGDVLRATFDIDPSAVTDCGSSGGA
ncbi:MAG: hypothetical protein AAGA55_07310 [Planctomycetota bacterium]